MIPSAPQRVLSELIPSFENNHNERRYSVQMQNENGSEDFADLHVNAFK
jgi:hypothetical protein